MNVIALNAVLPINGRGLMPEVQQFNHSLICLKMQPIVDTKGFPSRLWSLKRLAPHIFTLVKGKFSFFSKLPFILILLYRRHTLLLDRSGKVFAARASPPMGPRSDMRLLEIQKAIEELAKAFPEKRVEKLQNGATKRSTWPIATATWGFTCGPGMDVSHSTVLFYWSS